MGFGSNHKLVLIFAACSILLIASLAYFVLNTSDDYISSSFPDKIKLPDDAEYFPVYSYYQGSSWFKAFSLSKVLTETSYANAHYFKYVLVRFRSSYEWEDVVQDFEASLPPGFEKKEVFDGFHTYTNMHRNYVYRLARWDWGFELGCNEFEDLAKSQK
jgi:hypothetical protein